MLANPRINADAPRLLFAGLGFKPLLSLLAYSTSTRAPVMRQVVRQTFLNFLAIILS
jgi:uncharacterized protein YneF (UPF0154 family)